MGGRVCGVLVSVELELVHGDSKNSSMTTVSKRKGGENQSKPQQLSRPASHASP